MTRRIAYCLRATLLGCFGALLLAACSLTPPPVSPEEAARPLVAPDREIALPLPAELGRRVEATQLITIRRDGRIFVFEGHLSITPERLLLVGIDAVGRRAMTLTWSTEGLVAEAAPWLPAALRPGSMLADIVLLYWPEPVVRRALSPSGGQLLDTPTTRQISIDGRIVLQASHDFERSRRWTGRMRYANLAWGYEIDVQSEESQP